jgi:hypothetical protein
MIPINTHFATFSKLTLNTDTDKESYSNILNLTGIPCNIQPTTSNPSEMATGMFNKTHILYLSNTYSGIREGYRVQISGLYDGELNRILTVEGVEDWSKGPLPHFEINLSEQLK